MTKPLLLIPTIEPLELSKDCIASFQSCLAQDRMLAVVVYNGPDNCVASDLSHSHVVRLGYEDSRRLAERLAQVAECPEELLFGKQEYGRSYGGASNLLLAIARGLGASVMRKVDDDCAQLKDISGSRLDLANQTVGANKICFGPYVGRPSGFLRKLPEQTAMEWAAYIYSREKSGKLRTLGTGEGGSSVKNGI